MVPQEVSMQILEHQDIRLRALEPTDLELLYRWENDSEIWEVSNTLAPFSLYVLKQYLATAHLDIFETKQLRLVIESKSTNTPVGLIDLFDFDPFHQRAGIGIMIHDKANRRQGYAGDALETLCNYAFEVLQLHQLYCNITESNKASLKLFQKKGFEITGIKKEWIRTKACFEDEYLLQKINS